MLKRLCCLLLFTLPALAQDLTGHGGPVRALAVMGPWLASAGFDQAIIIWDPASGRARRVLRWHQGALSALVVLPDGRLASAGEEGRIAIWAAEGDAPAQVLEGHEAPIAGLAAHGDALASAGWDATVRVWRPGTTQVLEGHQGAVNAVAFTPDGRLHSAGQDGTLRRWDPDGLPRTLAEFGLPRTTLLALPDGTLAVGGVDGTVNLVSPDGTAREIVAGPRPVVALAASPDGGMLAVGGIGGGVTLHLLPAGTLRGSLDGPGLPVWSLAFAPDGRTLWSGGQDRRIRRWDAMTARPLGPLAPEADDAAANAPEIWRACQACHALRAEAGPMAGPHLAGLFGRRMGSLPGYGYSARLAQGDITWTPETVADLFTRGPDVVTPGTRMPVQRVTNAEELAALIRFLEEATAQ